MVLGGMGDTGAPPRMASGRPVGNADCPWDQFDSEAYLRHNYWKPHDLDSRAIRIMGRFFGSVGHRLEKANGIDVGSGTNLYPALAMLPLVQSVTFWEYSAPNVAWLRMTLSCDPPQQESLWQPFWDLLCESAPLYERVREAPLQQLRRKAVKPTAQNLFALPSETWDVGTMFFVAESISQLPAEFERATERFLTALKPGAPFAAAFMENSRGYSVGAVDFPAVAIHEHDVRRALRGLADDHQIHFIDSSVKFREGYGGMLLVTGQRNPRARAIGPAGSG